MTLIGRYCKAYPIKNFRQYEQWTENLENISIEKQKNNHSKDDSGLEIKRVLTDDDFLYLQENYVVTDGIFKDKNIIFDDVTSEWKEFCQKTLKFEVSFHRP